MKDFLKKHLGMIIGFIVAIVVIIIDQVTKIIANNTLVLNGDIKGSGLFRFHLLYNTGAGFSILKDSPWLLVLLSLLASILLGYAIYKYADNKKPLFYVSLGLLLGGCVGNLIDRFLTLIGSYNGVIDFIGIYFGDHLFLGTFNNVADMLLVTGMILLILYYLFFDKDKKENDKIKENKKYLKENESRGDEDEANSSERFDEGQENR
jgi:signal peptidase II